MLVAGNDRPRLFLTFANRDLELVRPVAAQLRGCAGGLALDYAVPREVFTAPRAELIRASLALRLKRCVATVCLFGDDTFEDDWVAWTLGEAQRLRHPLVGAPLTGVPAREAAALLADLGATVVPLKTEVIAQRVPLSAARRRIDVPDGDTIFDVLRAMRHPLR